MTCSGNPQPAHAEIRNLQNSPSVRIRSVLKRVIAILLLTCGTQAAPADDQAPNGPVPFLQQQLVQSRDLTRLLESAILDLDQGRTTQAFETLQTVLASPQDVFNVTEGGPQVSGVRQSATDVLRNASFTVRRQWIEQFEDLAAAALQQAVSAGNSAAIQNIAHAYPFTQTAFQIQCRQCRMAKDQGRIQHAADLLNLIQQDYVQLQLPYPTKATYDELASQLKAFTAVEPPSDTQVRLLTPYQQAPDAQLSLPWPESLWTWNESIWDYPAAGAALAGLIDPDTRPSVPSNAWQPVMTSDSVIVRTPLRIVCLDRLTGQVTWSLPTDTIESQQAVNPPDNDSPFSQLPARNTAIDATSLQLMERMGTLTTDGRFLYFLDDFRPFGRSESSSSTTVPLFRGLGPGQFGNRFRVPAEQADTSGGSRLVAVRLTPQPVLAWTVQGTAPVTSFSYQFAHNTENNSDTSPPHISPPARRQPPTTNVPDDDNPFLGHQFCGVPLIRQQSLFILSSDDEFIWLNCLNHATGRLLWQHQLCYAEDSKSSQHPLGFRTPAADQHAAASLCGIVGSSVICSLSNGLLIAADSLDGRLLWATNANDAMPQVTRERIFSYSATDQRPATVPLHPVIIGNRIVWASPSSRQISCVDAASGRILWQIPRSVTGAGAVDNSEDLYAVGGFQNQILLVGNRHVRALAIEDGLQTWIAPIPLQSGTAVQHDDLCLIPLHSGKVLAIDVATGQQVTTGPASSVPQPTPVIGNLLVDEDFVCVSTPLQVSLFPTVTAVRKRLQSLPAAERSLPEVRLALARSEILNGNVTAGCDLLQQILTDNPEGTPAQTLLTEFLLQALGHNLQTSQSGVPPATAHPDARFQNLSTATIRSRLDNLPLSDEQSLRQQLMLALYDIETAGPAPQLATQAFNTSRMVQLLPEWELRSDIGVHAAFPALASMNLTSANPANSTSVPPAADTPQVPGIHQIERRILFSPATIDVDTTLATVDQLERISRQDAAELLLLQTLNQLAPSQRLHVLQRIDRLRSLRQHSPATEADSMPDQPITAGMNVSIDETLQETINPGLYSTLLSGIRGLSDSPSWFEHRLMMSRGAAAHRLSVVDMHQGNVRAAIDLSANLDTALPVPAGDAVPGIIPLEGIRHIGMLSLLNSDGPRLLWQKRIPADGDQIAGSVTLSPPGPGYFVWKTETRLFNHHPLTGRLLWSRELIADSGPAQLFGKVTDLTTDEDCVAVFGRNMRSYQLFSTQTGQHIHDGLLDLPDGQTPMLFGRRVLFADYGGRLRLYDLLTHQDLMDPAHPIHIVEGARADMLANKRVVTITDQQKLVVIDCQTGKTVFSHPLSNDDISPSFVGIDGFERNGCLFVLLRDLQGRDPSRTAAPLLQEPRLDYGTLICLDAETGQRRWSHRCQPAVMPPVYGDPTDLIVLWALEDTERLFNRQLGPAFPEDNDSRSAAGGSSLHLQILDGRTGHLIGERRNLTPSAILRCVHNAARRQIRLETKDSVITVSYDSIDDSLSSTALLPTTAHGRARLQPSHRAALLPAILAAGGGRRPVEGGTHQVPLLARPAVR